MKRNRRLAIGLVLAVAVVPLRAQQAESAGDKATIRALLDEVRQLRLAMERSTSIVPRMQLTVARYQLQQDRVDRLGRELRDIRAQIAQLSSEKVGADARMKQAESSADQNAPLREQFKKELTAQLEMFTQREEQLRAQEADLASQVQREQNRLAELSDQLDTLDKKLQEGAR